MRTVSLLLLLLSAMTMAQQQEPLRAIVSDSNTPPYAIFAADASLQAGISKDIIDELSRQLQRPVSYFNLPRTRVEPWLQEGKAELACFLNPDWVVQPDLLLWTEPLFTTQQLLVRRHDTKPLTGIQYLAGKRVGTTRGFTYPELEQVFALGDVIRDDAHTLESNLKRLEQGRLDAVMSVDLSYYFFMANGGLGNFAADPLWSTPPSVYCAISRFNPKLAATLLEGLHTLVDNKFIDRQLRRYKGERVE